MNAKRYDKNYYLVFIYLICLDIQVEWERISQQECPDRTDFFHIHNYGFGEVTPDHIHEADFDLKVITGDVAINPTLHIHTQIYQKRSDVMSIVHTHAKHVSALSAIGQNIVHLTQSAARLFEDCLFFDENDGVALGKEPGAMMANTLGEKSALVLKNHGLLTVGSSIAEAVVLANTMEETAEIQLLAMSAGKINLPSSSGAQRTKEYLRNEHKISRSWSYLMRNLARERPEVLEM